MEEFFDVLNERGEFLNYTESRDVCHMQGLWHRAVYGFIFDKKGNCLLQKRSKTKKLWPDLWDVPTGGHVLAGEIGTDALIRETKEELGIDISISEITYLFGSQSSNVSGNITNNHFNECYLITKDIDINNLTLQVEEVQEVRWFSKEEILNRIDNNFDGLTDKTGPWNFLKRTYERFFK